MTPAKLNKLEERHKDILDSLTRSLVKELIESYKKLLTEKEACKCKKKS